MNALSRSYPATAANCTIDGVVIQDRALDRVGGFARNAVVKHDADGEYLVSPAWTVNGKFAKIRPVNPAARFENHDGEWRVYE